MRKWNYLVIHHTATDARQNVATIDLMHEKRGFARADPRTGRVWHIGYHYLLERDEAGHGHLKAGRPDHLDGAHTTGLNGKAIGLAVVGYFHPGHPISERMTAVLTQDLLAAVAHLVKKYGIPPDHISYHRDHKSTACPGAWFIPKAELLAELRRVMGNWPEW